MSHVTSGVQNPQWNNGDNYMREGLCLRYTLLSVSHSVMCTSSKVSHPYALMLDTIIIGVAGFCANVTCDTGI